MLAALPPHRRTSRGVGGLAFLLVVLTPAISYACPVCFDANEANRTAFVVTTIFLSTLPLAMVGGIALWVRRVSEGRSKDGV